VTANLFSDTALFSDTLGVLPYHIHRSRANLIQQPTARELFPPRLFLEHHRSHRSSEGCPGSSSCWWNVSKSRRRWSQNQSIAYSAGPVYHRFPSFPHHLTEPRVPSSSHRHNSPPDGTFFAFCSGFCAVVSRSCHLLLQPLN
jgi:hypothetical protein